MARDEVTRHRYVLYVDIDLIGDESPPPFLDRLRAEFDA